MKALNILFTALLISSITFSCKKDDDLGSVDNIPGLGGDTWPPGPIDHWIYDTLTVPYNISVKYKWDQSELDLNKTLVPPMEEKVIPLLSAVRKGWIQPYVDEAGLLFFKTISPKFLVLVGSPSFNSDGSVTLGTAEGGRKVVLYNVNKFRYKGLPGYTLADSVELKRVFWAIHHEFAHILDQNIQVPVEFSQSSASSYTSDWTNVSQQEALNEGFISSYAISGKFDDWAETVSFLLINGRAWFDNLVNSINYTGTTANGTTAEQAKARLRQKESVVISYFNQAWNIHFYNLQLRSRFAISSLIY